VVLCRTIQGQKTCARRPEKLALDRARCEGTKMTSSRNVASRGEGKAIFLKALGEVAVAGANWVVSHFHVGVKGGGTSRVKAPRRRAPETCKLSETSTAVRVIFCCCCSLFKRLCVCLYLHEFDDKMHE